MKKRTKLLAGAAIALGVAGGAAGVAVAGGQDTDTPIRGDARERASAAALKATGGGRVTGTEVGDEDSYYEVEVTLDDGRQVDVQLDESFTVVDTMADHDGAGDVNR